MKQKFSITGLDCPNCAAKLATLIEKEEGIESAKINFLTEKLTVESEIDAAATLALIEKVAKKFSPDIEIEAK